MKANHNFEPAVPLIPAVVTNISCLKNESKSQPIVLTYDTQSGCYKYQLFKEWKQITTSAAAYSVAA